MSTVELPTAIERIAQDLQEGCGHSPGNAVGVAITSIRALAKGKVKVRGVARNDARNAMTALAEAKLQLPARDGAVRRLEQVEARAKPMTQAELRHVVERARHRKTVAEGLLLAFNGGQVAAGRSLDQARKFLGDPVLSSVEAAQRLSDYAAADRVIVEMFAGAVQAQGRAAPQVAAAPAAPAAGQASSAQFEQLHPRNRTGQWIAKGEGMTGEPSGRVEQLQRRLSQLGFRLNPDGRFGPMTEDSVKAFQRTYGLEETGKVDAATIETLRNPPPKTAQEVQAETVAAEKGKAGAAGAAGADTTTTAAAGATQPTTVTATGSNGAAPSVDWTDPEAVKAFQREHGLNPTGDVDAETRGAWSAVNSQYGRSVGDRKAVEKGGGSPEQKTKAKETATATANGDTMRQGDGLKGKPDPDVKEAQQLLAALGFDLGEGGTDGRFGPDTKAAVMNLQRKYGLEVDGIIGPQTLRLLTRLKERRASQAKDKKAQASTDVLGAGPDREEGREVEEATVINNAIVAGNVSGDATAYGGAVPFILGVAPITSTGQKPPNLRKSTGWRQCRNCVWFRPQHECIRYEARVDDDEVCADYHTVTPEVEKQARAEAKLAEAEASGDTVAILRARARLEEVWVPHHPLAHLWDPALHPRDRRGQFIEVLNRLGEGEAVKLPSGATVTRHQAGFTYAPGGAAQQAGPTFRGAAEAAAHAIEGESREAPKSVGPAADVLAQATRLRQAALAKLRQGVTLSKKERYDLLNPTALKGATMSTVTEALAYDAVETLREAEISGDTTAIVRARARVQALDEAVLTAKARKSLPDSAFVYPKEKRYPIHDRRHGANALSRASGKPEFSTVKAAVCKRYSDLPECQGGGK